MGGGWNSITNTAFLRAPDNTPIDTVNSPLVQLCDNYFRDYDDHTVLNNCLMATYVSSASSLTLGYNSHYSFNGTTGTWTLPAISSLIKGANKVILIKNRGTGSLTINTSGGLNTLFDGSATNNIILGVGEKAMLFPDGTYINVE